MADVTAFPSPAATGRLAAVVMSAATLAGYVLLVTWLTWPLGGHLETHLANMPAAPVMDTYHSLWALSWETHVLSVSPANLLNAPVYFPARHALLYGTMGLGTLPYFAPTFLATGNPVLAANLAFIACIALAAWGLHCVVWRWTRSWAAALVAAGAFLLTPWMLWTWTPGRPVHFPLQYFPWIIALAAPPGWSARRSVALGVLVVLQCLTDPLYVAPAVVAPLVVVALARSWRPETRVAARGLARMLVVALLMLAPVYACYAALRAENPGLSRQSRWGTLGDTPDARPWDGLILAGGIYADLRPTGMPWVTIPLVALGLLSFLCRPDDERAATRTPWLHAGLWVVIGMLISTRAIIWLGDPPTVIPSPVFLILDQLVPTVVNALRGTIRLSVGALVAMALLAGLAFAECERRFFGGARWAAWVCALALIGSMYAYWPGRMAPYPLREAPAAHTPIIAALRASCGPVLELPAGASRATVHAQAMYRSIFHRRPLLNGYGSYWPIGFPERMQLAGRLPDPEAWATLRRETGLETILVHPNDPRFAAWLDLASRGDGSLHLVARDGKDLLFSALPGAICNRVGDAP